MRGARFSRLASRPLGSTRRAPGAPRRARAMMDGPRRSTAPEILVAHSGEKSAKREHDDGGSQRPAMMGDERFTSSLHQRRRQQPEDAADQKQPAKDGDQHAPIANPKMVHIEHGKAERERYHA